VFLTKKLSADEAVKAKEEVATDPKKFPATVKDPEITVLPDMDNDPVTVCLSVTALPRFIPVG
jgi:hypothetical protein